MEDQTMNVSEMSGTQMLNPLYSVATDGTIAYAEQILDGTNGGNKFQTYYNKLTKKAIKLAKAGL